MHLEQHAKAIAEQCQERARGRKFGAIPWAMLFEFVATVLIPLIQDCFEKEEDVAANIKEMPFRARVGLKIAVRRALREQGDNGRIGDAADIMADAVTDYARAMEPAAIEAVLVEASQV